MIFAGAGIGTIVAFGLYATKTAYVALLPVVLAVALPAAVVKNYRLYWFAIFLLSVQLAISKNLNDGKAVIDELHIDYTIWKITFQVSPTDLVLLILVAIWANDRMFHGKPLRFPSVAWLAVGYLVLSLFSTVGAASPYLGLVQIFQEFKFLIVYLFAVNCLDTKSALRVLVIVGVIILVTQGGVTAIRSATGYVTPFGYSDSDVSRIEQYLTVDRSDVESGLRGFGTLTSPGSTTRLCMMLIPFALFLSVRNAMFRMPLAFAALAAFGLVCLMFTFSRVYYILTALQCGLVFLIMIRDRMLNRQAVVLIVLVGLAAVAAISPKLYQQFTIREDSASVRWLQYEAAAKMILDHPFFGVGMNNSTAEKPKYASSTYHRGDANTQFYLEPTHNLYLSLASEIGIFGALLFVAFFANATLLAWRQSRHSTDPEIRLVANAFVVAFFGVAVSGLMDPLVEEPVLTLVWLYAGIILNLPKMAQGRETVARRTEHKVR